MSIDGITKQGFKEQCKPALIFNLIKKYKKDWKRNPTISALAIGSGFSTSTIQRKMTVLQEQGKITINPKNGLYQINENHIKGNKENSKTPK